MKFIQRWFDGLVKASWDRARDGNQLASESKVTIRGRDQWENDNGLNLQVFKAVGGKIVSFNNYDHKLDRNKRTVYIITDEQEFEKELGKNITLESLR